MLNQDDIIKLAIEHGFQVGRDASGEYVAPKYEDSVGSLVALVQAAYVLGQQTKPQAEPVVVATDSYAFHTARGVMGTENSLQDKTLRRAIEAYLSHMAVPSGYAQVPDVPKPIHLRRQMRRDGGYDMVPAYTAEEMRAYAHQYALHAVQKGGA